MGAAAVGGGGAPGNSASLLPPPSQPTQQASTSGAPERPPAAPLAPAGSSPGAQPGVPASGAPAAAPPGTGDGAAAARGAGGGAVAAAEHAPADAGARTGDAEGGAAGGGDGGDGGERDGRGGAAEQDQRSAAAEERRTARRKRHRAEHEAARRWDLRARLADVSADVELLTLEARGPVLVLPAARRQALRARSAHALRGAAARAPARPACGDASIERPWQRSRSAAGAATLLTGDERAALAVQLGLGAPLPPAADAAGARPEAGAARAQVAWLQQAAAGAPARPRELSKGERGRLADARVRRLADLVPKHCLAVLKALQAHPVRRACAGMPAPVASPTLDAAWPCARRCRRARCAARAALPPCSSCMRRFGRQCRVSRPAEGPARPRPLLRWVRRG